MVIKLQSKILFSTKKPGLARLFYYLVLESNITDAVFPEVFGFYQLHLLLSDEPKW